MKQFFQELFEYSHFYNQQLADVLIENQVSEKATKLYSHILSAHQIWNNRIEPLTKPFGVWQIHSADTYRAVEQSNYEQSLHILDRYDLDATINYANTKGQSFTNIVRNVLFHVINHSTYHRAQIATEFRQNEVEPIKTDFIFFKRL